MDNINTNTTLMDSPNHYALDDTVIQAAVNIMEHKLSVDRPKIEGPEDLKKWLTLSLLNKDHEVVVVVYLDLDGRVIAHEELFQGTLDQTPMYPREIVKHALAYNAGGVIVAHNHPSTKIARASDPDIRATRVLKAALDTVGVSLLAHVVVGGDNIAEVDTSTNEHDSFRSLLEALTGN